MHTTVSVVREVQRLVVSCLRTGRKVERERAKRKDKDLPYEIVGTLVVSIVDEPMSDSKVPPVTTQVKGKEENHPKVLKVVREILIHRHGMSINVDLTIVVLEPGFDSKTRIVENKHVDLLLNNEEILQDFMYINVSLRNLPT